MTWNVGVLLLLLVIAAAFFGYVLPWGQMSFWGTSVITNLLSALPWLGADLVVWLWGGFAVRGPTLTRFFTFHFLVPFVVAALASLHLLFAIWAFSLLIFSLVWGVSSQRWICLWIRIELNLMAFIRILYGRMNARLATLQYFLVQSLGSAFLLIRILSLERQVFTFGGKPFFTTLIILRIIWKLGRAPLHGWLIYLRENLNWSIFFLLMRVQKLLPLVFLASLSLSGGRIVAILRVNLIVRLFRGLGEANFKRFIVYSSIMALSWILARLPRPLLVYGYLFFYSFSLWALRYLCESTGVEEIEFFEKAKPNLAFVFIFAGSLLQLAGFPPFILFYLKIIVLQTLIRDSRVRVGVILLIAAGVFLYFYLRWGFPASLGTQVASVASCPSTMSYRPFLFRFWSLFIVVCFSVNQWWGNLTPLK